LEFLKQKKKFKFILRSTRIVITLSLGLACKVVGLEKKPGIERKCEGMNLHTPKGASTLGVGVQMDSQMFRERLQGPKLNGLRSYLYHLKAIEI
jgi:hypothetical protein